MSSSIMCAVSVEKHAWMLGAVTVVALGGLGGILYWCAIFPVDVIKSAMQTDHIDPAQRKFPTMASAAKVCAC